MKTNMPKETKSKPAADAKKGGDKKAKERKKSNVNTPITREATINLHKRIHGVYVLDVCLSVGLAAT